LTSGNLPKAFTPANPDAMSTTLTFGDSINCELSLDDFTFLAADVQRHPTLRDPASAVREALARPKGFPALSAATVPGDHVAVAIDASVPQASNILRGVIAAMLDAKVAPAMITVVTIDEIENREDLTKQLSAMGAGAVKFQRHDPDDEQALAMIGVNSRGEPLRLNRTLAEADFVLPIGAAPQPASEGAPIDKFGSLFPQ